MSNPDLRIREFPVNPQTPFSSKTRIAPLTVVLMALVCLATLAASAQAVNFGSINVCPAGTTTPAPCSANQTVTFTIPAGTTISSIPILTTGIPDLDFKAKADDPSTTLCKAQTYSSATTCTVDVTFAPIAPGARNGAVELLNGSTVVAMTYVYGTGVGPQVVFNPPALQTLAPSTLGGSMTVDGSGNIFILAFPDNVAEVIEFLADAGYTPKTLYTAGNESHIPGNTIVVDGAGNLFFGGSLTNQSGVGIIELVAAEGYAAQSLGEGAVHGFGQFENMAIDGSGNLFLQNGHNIDTVYEILADGGYTTVKAIGGFNELGNGPVLDASGNVFVTDSLGLKEILAAGGYTTVKTLNANYPFANILAVDAADNVYLSEYPNLAQLIAADGYSTVNTIYPPSNSAGFSLADGFGNFYGHTSTSLVRLNRSQPPAFSFAATDESGISSDSPRSATLQNIGNATLTGSVTLTSTDFILDADVSTPPECTASFSLTSSAECNLNIDFTPQTTGDLTASAVITDNSGSGTQSIELSGTGIATTVLVSPPILEFGSILYTDTPAKALTITNAGTTTLTIDPSSNGRGAVITGNTCGAGIGAGKSCTLEVEFKPIELGFNHNTITVLTNGPRNPTISVRGTATGVAATATAIDFGTIKGRGKTESQYLFVENVGVPGNVTVTTETGATTFHVTGNTCSTGVTAGNYCYLTVEFAPVQTGPETAYLKLIPSTGPTQVVVMTGDLIP
jgi:hypothetical protein